MRKRVSEVPRLTIVLLALTLLWMPSNSVASEGEEAAEADSQESSNPLPVNISGHAMFRYTWSLDLDDPNGAELYNLRLYLERSFEGISLYAEPRFRQTPLRSFSPSNIWVQEAWVAFDEFHDSVGTLRAGLIYNRTGLSWDRSWFGNLVYLNGLKLDPDYGIEAVGTPEWDLGGNATAGLHYGLQFFPVEDGLNGFFAPSFKLDRLNATPAGGWPIDFDSAPGYTERDIIVGEIAPTLSIGDVSLRAGLSVARSRLVRQASDDFAGAQGRELTLGVKGELGWKGFSVHGEWLRQQTRGIDVSSQADQRIIEYGLAGLAYTWSRETRWLRDVELRVNGSHVHYHFADVDEWFVAPGLHVRLHKLLGVTAEYVRWEFADREVVDRVEWILHAYF